MDEHAPGTARPVVRRHVEAVHALPVRVLEVPRLERPRRGGIHAERHDLSARVVDDDALTMSCSCRNQMRPSGRTAPSRCSRGRSESKRRLTAGDVVAVEEERPSRRFCRSSADPSGHQSAAETSPSRSSRNRAKSPVSRFQIAGRVSPSRSWPHASRWSRNRRPAAGDQQPPRRTARRPSPAERGSRTRSAEWMRSPCSACSRQREFRPPRARRGENLRSRRFRGAPSRSRDGSSPPCRRRARCKRRSRHGQDRRSHDPRSLRETFAPPCGTPSRNRVVSPP